MEITPVVTFLFYDRDKLCVQSVASKRIGCRGRRCQHVRNMHYECRIIYYERPVENLTFYGVFASSCLMVLVVLSLAKMVMNQA